MPDPGRLSEILTPGRELYLRKAIASKHRKTNYSKILAKYRQTPLDENAILESIKKTKCAVHDGGGAWPLSCPITNGH